MQQPNSSRNEDIKKFLLWCSKNRCIELWNKWRDSHPGIKINLNEANLQGANLAYANLCCIELIRAHLNGADLNDSDLSKSNLNGAYLSGADLSMANLSYADLRLANLSNANLSYANLRDANLWGAILRNTNNQGIILGPNNSRLFDNYSLIPNANKTKISSQLKLAQAKIKELEEITNKSGKESSKLRQELLKTKQGEKQLQITLQNLEDEKNQETKSINEIIGYLGKIPEEISSEQSYSKSERGRFSLFATTLFGTGALIAIALVVNSIIGNPLNLPTISNPGQYLAYALSVAFPMILSFLFQRQVNIKSKEIDKINEKSIIIQQVENALNAYNVLLSGKRLEDKTIGSIDRVLDKLFENGHEENRGTKTEESKVNMGDLQKFIKTLSDVAKH